MVVTEGGALSPGKKTLANFVLMLGLAFPVAARPPASSDADNPRGKYVTALSALKSLAEEGNSFAQLALGVMYFNGWNTPRDYVQARKWFNLASSRSPPGADHNAALADCGFR
jgi:TPR repeat protein